MLIRLFWAGFTCLLILLPFRVGHSAELVDQPPTTNYFEKTWFSDFSMGLKIGSSIQEKSLNDGNYPRGLLMGPELTLDIFKLKYHKLGFNLGYLYFDHSPSKGSQMLTVKTDYRRIDASVGYDFVWKLLLVGVRAGAAINFITVTTTYGEPSWEVVYQDYEGAEIVYYPPESKDTQTLKNNGVDVGVLAGLSLGMAFGEFLFKKKDLFEIRTQTDYVRRGTRNEWTVLGLICIYPTKLF